MTMMKNKNTIIYVSILVGLLVILAITLLIVNYNKSKQTKINEVYGVVKEVYDDSIIIEDKDGNNSHTLLIEGTKYNKGDLVFIKEKDGRVEDSKLIVENYSELTTSPIIVVDNTTTTTTTSKVTTTTKNTTKKITTTVDKDEEVLNYFKSQHLMVTNNKDTSTSMKDKLKNGFISLVDFIFYGAPIKGVTFNELKDSTKEKVIYYALLIDGGIDSKFPNYKANISTKYKDIKSKLVVEFLELKYNMCEKSQDGCKQAKDDFELLKYSLNLTWDVVKGFLTNVKDLTVPKIKSWYESFRG
jgi:hypothetical protein